MVVQPGAVLGRYQIETLIGRGGMGEVYRAGDTRLRRDVAVKVLPAAFTSDAERMARFEREAHLLASLNQLGGHYDAEVHFLHVIPSALIHPEQYPYVAEAIPLAPEFRQRALERLDAFVALSRAEGVRTRFSVVGSWAKRRRMRDVSRRALPSAVRATGPPAQSPALSVALW
jgi:hypothetical protein